VDPRSESQEAPCSPGTFIDAFHRAIFGSALRIIFGFIAALVPKPKYWKGVATSHEFLDFYVRKVMEGRESAAQQSKTQDMENFKHSSLIEGLIAQTDDKLYIRYQILQGLMASQETTSNLLGNTLFLLSRNPVYWQQIRKEAIEKGDSLLSFDALLSSKPLQNILHECKSVYSDLV
jgi:cytochrome P450